MCWNATSSISFFISGFIINLIILQIAIAQKKNYLVAFCLGWFFVLCMQLLEYFIWSRIGNKTTLGYLTFYFNIFQILVVYLVALSVSRNYNIPMLNKILASIIVMIYLGGVLWMTRKMQPNDYIVDTSQKHLPYPWWDHMKNGGLLYLFSLITIFLLLFRPFQWALLTIITIVLLLVFSYIIYKPYVASMWCFFVVFMPLFSFLFTLLPAYPGK